jgi:DNA-binding MarR family transcriptional regulator
MTTRHSATAAELGRRLGVTKQAAAKTIAALQELGYVERRPDPDDRRSVGAHLTRDGEKLLGRSAEIFDALRDEWAARVGDRRLRELERDLITLVADDDVRIDMPGWITGAANRSR